MFTARYGLNIYDYTFWPHSVFMCFVWISEQTAIISLYSINLSVFITEAESVYCAVRTGSLNQTATISSSKDEELNNFFDFWYFCLHKQYKFANHS